MNKSANGNKADDEQISRAQRRTINEVNSYASIASMLDMKVSEDAVRDLEYDARIPVLNNLKTRIVRGGVLEAYLFIDEILSVAVNRKLAPKANRRTVRKKTANMVLERLFFLDKYNIFCRLYDDVPKDVRKFIQHINSLRNDVAHSFMPESRFLSKPNYQGSSIFKKEVYAKFEDDYSQVMVYFVKLNFQIDISEYI